ncbi:kynureninase [Curvivirga aplysinae]|uniref:kynureninase n=1 Tax=Curvivirga aplysinae TaxID=2529852 RepID=UPI0012BB4D0C|nr:kynureninase [Curvivirga aplysinae]MTI08459.1 kynureninase [Curvivirga aplysinae]
MYTLEKLQELDAQDPLARYRDEFELADGLIYLDGNSLGPLPKRTKERVIKGIDVEWGTDLITSWNKHGWMNKPHDLGDMIAPIVGADKGTIKVGDSTSVNVFKSVAAALKIAKSGRSIVLSDTANFPTDLYMIQGLQELIGKENCELKVVDETEVEANLTEEIAVLLLNEVNFRTGRKYDMHAITQQAQAKGIIVIWDLCHSAGAFPVDLKGTNTDFAIGCGYKYLNGGPGAPAFIYVADRHKDAVIQPLSGWHGHKSPFEFSTEYVPSDTQTRFVVGTPPVLSLLALEAGLEIWQDVDMQQLREKSLNLTDAFIELVETRCAEYGFTLATPRERAQRGSQVSFAHKDGYPIMQALIADKVIGDFRAPNLLRFGFTPLYTSYQDVWDAVERLHVIMADKKYDKPEYRVKAAVT